MLKHLSFLIAIWLMLGTVSFAADVRVVEKVDPNLQAQARGWMQQPVRFLENKGQMTNTDNKPVPFVLFKASAPGMDMYITKEGLTCVFVKSEDHSTKEEMEKESNNAGMDQEEEQITAEMAWLNMRLKGAIIKEENIVKEGASSEHFNFFYAHCPEGIYGVKQYEKITIKDVYPDIDWVFYNAEKQGMKYDFVVHPGADPAQIKLIYESQSPLKINEQGGIEITTPLGTYTEQAPYSYLEGSSNEVPSRFAAQSIDEHSVEISFDIPTLKLPIVSTIIIDPQLTWATFYGGSADVEGPMSVTSDAAGNVFVAGYSWSTNFPVQNAGTFFQGTYGGGVSDGFILKFDNIGNRLWATYCGGSGNDYNESITADGSGNIFVTGLTDSPNFPLQNAATFFQGAYGGGFYDTFILKFDNTGNLLWATYYGGSGSEVGYSITADGSGNVFVTGQTNSANFPVQNPGGGAYYQGTNAGLTNAFILKFDNAGNRLWATYYGGSNTDIGYSITTDGSGNVFVAGQTQSAVFPVQNAGTFFQGTYGGGVSDGFILKFDNAGNRLWATYYGGSEEDKGYSIATDGSGNVFMTGSTTSINFPVQNPGGAYFQGTFAGGFFGDAFILKFDNAGNRLWATYYGGSENDRFGSHQNLAINSCGNVYMSFYTNSQNLPTQASCDGGYHDSTFAVNVNGGTYDIFLILFSNTGTLLWSTYIGGDGWDFREALNLDPNDNLFIVGEWTFEPISASINSATYPVTNPGGGAYCDSTFNGSHDGYILKFCGAPCICSPYNGCTVSNILSVTITSQNILCNAQCAGSAAATPVGNNPPYSYSWSNGQTTQTVTGLCSGIYTVTVTDSTSATATATISVTQPAVLSGSVTVTTASCNSQCNGTSVITAGGGTPGYIYSWSTIPVQTTANATGLCAGNYTAAITDANGCTATQTVTVVSSGSVTATAGPNSTICAGEAATLTSTGGTTYSWSSGNTNSTIIVSPAATSTYSVIVSSSNNCPDTASAIVVVNPIPTATVWSLPAGQAGNITITAGSSTTLSASGGGTYSWSNGATGSSITVTPPVTIIYCVTVTDANGCTDTACVTVYVEPLDCSTSTTGELYLPNAFSPNGDNENDVLKIYYGNPQCIKTFKLIIYDRWGEKIFESKNPIAEWDGSYKGKTENTAVFVYYLEATFISGEEISRKGNISIFR